MADKEAPRRPTASGADRISALPEVNLVEEMVANETLVNHWIQSAVSCGVRVLQLRFSRDCTGFLDLPDLSLVTSKHLTKIEFAGVAIFHKLNLSGCPAMQDLKIEDCFLFSNEIQAPYLKHLTIAKCLFRPVTRTKIRLPSLISLKCIECNGRIPLFLIVFIRDLKNACAFRKLKALVLTDWFVVSASSALIWFLHHSPVLEKLTLQISKVHKIRKDTEGRRKLPEQAFASSNLKIVEIKCHGVDKTVIEILKILTTFGVPLERINIQCSSTDSGCVNFKCTSFNSN